SPIVEMEKKVQKEKHIATAQRKRDPDLRPSMEAVQEDRIDTVATEKLKAKTPFVSGIVVDEEDSPVYGAKVFLAKRTNPTATTPDYETVEDTISTDGTFSFTTYWGQGDYSIYALHGEVKSSEKYLFKIEHDTDTKNEITLVIIDVETSISGRVFHEGTGEPVPDASVIIYTQLEGEDKTVVTDDGGYYQCVWNSA
ncbi:unnamed protein product, partial [marine sediment metagenome]